MSINTNSNIINPYDYEISASKTSKASVIGVSSLIMNSQEFNFQPSHLNSVDPRKGRINFNQSIHNSLDIGGEVVNQNIQREENQSKLKESLYLQIPDKNSKSKSKKYSDQKKERLDTDNQIKTTTERKKKQSAKAVQPGQVIVNGYLVTLDETTGQYKMQKIDEIEKKLEFKDKYFFHSMNWQKKVQQQHSINQQREAALQLSKGKMSFRSLNYIADNNQFPEMQKIKSRCFRRNTKELQKVDLSQINQYNEVDILNKTLEKHVEQEIFIPKSLIDPGLLQAQARLKLDRMLEENKKDRNSPEIKAARELINESQEAKINRNLFQIEKRLGLKKSDKVGVLNQMANIKQTQKNIDLIEEEIQQANKEKQQQKDDSSKNVNDQLIENQTPSSQNKNQKNSDLKLEKGELSLRQIYSINQSSKFIQIKDETEGKTKSSAFNLKEDLISSEMSKGFMNQRLFSQERSKRQNPQATQSLPKNSSYFSQGIFKSGLHPSISYGVAEIEQPQRNEDQKFNIPSINNSPMQLYQNADFSASNRIKLSNNNKLQYQNLRKSLFSNQSHRYGNQLEQNSLSYQYQNSNSLRQKCHGNKNQQIMSTKQKLIERLFERPKDEGHSRTSRYQTLSSDYKETSAGVNSEGGDDQSSMMQNQFLQRKNHIKKLLLDILEQEHERYDENKNFIKSDTSNRPGYNFISQRMSGSMEMKERHVALSDYQYQQPPLSQTFDSIHHNNENKDLEEQILNELFSELDKDLKSKVHQVRASQKSKLKKSPIKHLPGTSQSKQRQSILSGSTKENNNLHSFQSLEEESDLMDEDQLIKQGKKGFSSNKFELYNKYLNVLLLKNRDSFIQMMYQKYLRTKRRGKNEQREKNFYERMQYDILKRKLDEKQKEDLQYQTTSHQQSMVGKIESAQQSSNISHNGSQTRLTLIQGGSRPSEKLTRKITIKSPVVNFKRLGTLKNNTGNIRFLQHQETEHHFKNDSLTNSPKPKMVNMNKNQEQVTHSLFFNMNTVLNINEEEEDEDFEDQANKSYNQFEQKYYMKFCAKNYKIIT